MTIHEHKSLPPNFIFNFATKCLTINLVLLLYEFKKKVLKLEVVYLNGKKQCTFFC